MGRSSAVGRGTLLALAVLVSSAACGGDDEPDAPAAAASAEAGTAPPSAFASSAFSVPLELSALPTWLPERPAEEAANFLTWTGEGEWIERAVRFLVPVSVYPPGSASTAPVPQDYLGFLRGQTQFGARFSDETALTIDGHSATVMTATTSTSLDGGLGCPEDGIAASDCYGVQPNLALRMAVVEVDSRTLLAWTRAAEGADNTEQFADFETMLAGLRFA